MGRLTCALVGLGLVAALTGCAASRAPSDTASRPAGAAALVGMTWGMPGSVPSVVFTDHTVRIFDGCSNALHALTIGADSLDIGAPLGKRSSCGAASGWPPLDVAAFDRVLDDRHLSWQVTNGTLRLTNEAGDVVDLHSTGPASDLCNELTGSAATGDTTITFADLHRTGRACPDRTAASVAEVIDRVLSGTADYAIRGEQLIVSGKGGGLLVYTPSHAARAGR